MTATDVRLTLPSGEITGKSWGDPAAPLVLCLPGFSQDERSFDAIGPALTDHHVVALALRGRGRSTSAPTAEWGPLSHAQDVLEVARQLGQERLSMIGWSFGGLVAMHVASVAADKVASIALVDVAGTPDPESGAAVAGNQIRLTTTFATEEEYVEHVLGSGMFDGAEEFFRDYLRGELVATDGGFRTRTTAVIAQDAARMSTSTIDELWPSLSMPVLLLRAARPILPGHGFIVPASERDRFVAAVPTARAVDIDANHGAIGVDDASVAAIREFFSG